MAAADRVRERVSSTSSSEESEIAEALRDAVSSARSRGPSSSSAFQRVADRGAKVAAMNVAAAAGSGVSGVSSQVANRIRADLPKLENNLNSLKSFTTRVGNDVKSLKSAGSDIHDEWDRCLGGLKNLRITVFVVLFVTILLFLGQIFNWSTPLLLLLIITQLVCISYEALQLTSETSDACYFALRFKRPNNNQN